MSKRYKPGDLIAIRLAVSDYDYGRVLRDFDFHDEIEDIHVPLIEYAPILIWRKDRHHRPVDSESRTASLLDIRPVNADDVALLILGADW